jgi:SAM-dependent methyltransferase
MTDWTSGYIADVNYTYGYYTELNVLRARFSLLASGIAIPSFGTACELGFGQGVSTNIHAAASTVQWYGTDFNPAQAAVAQDMARVSGADAKLFDQSFAEFAARDDLPDFDFIALHGIWSWVSEENRATIVNFIRRKLKVGGVVYISYNTLPGWSSFAPIRHLMTQHAGLLSAEGNGIVNRVNGALDFVQKVVDTNPLYVKLHPGTPDRLKRVREQNRQYLAHEYFNKIWDPMYFATVAELLAGAKLDFACTAHYIDGLDAINLTKEQQKIISDIPDELMRQTVRDFMVNRQFRKDYWVRGFRRMPFVEQAEALRASQFILTSKREDIKLVMTGSLGSANMNEKVYVPVLDALASHDVKSIAQIEKAIAGNGIEFGQLIQAVQVLMSLGHLAPVQPEAVISKAKKQTDNLNSWIVSKARSDGDISFIASPVTGGGIPVSRFEQLFLLALGNGAKTAADLARPVWQTLLTQKHKIVKEGKALETPEENIAELQKLAQDFLDKKLPILKALKIA